MRILSGFLARRGGHITPERFVFAKHPRGVSRDHFIFKLKYSLHVLKCTDFHCSFDMYIPMLSSREHFFYLIFGIWSSCTT